MFLLLNCLSIVHVPSETFPRLIITYSIFPAVSQSNYSKLHFFIAYCENSRQANIKIINNYLLEIIT